MSESPVAAAERHPIQGLLDEVDLIVIGVPVPDGNGGAMIHPMELDDELKAYLKESLMSAYATGVTRATD